MHEPSRRQFLAGSAAAAATFTFPGSFVHAQKGGGTLRFVPHADLRVLDVTRYTGYITNRTNAYLIYDTLFSQDEKGQIRPQMVDTWTMSPDRRKWSFTLRDGLKFHDGQPVTAEDCVASLRRWSQRDPLGQFFIAATERLQATDKKSFVLELGKPFGLVLEALAKPSAVVPFILPARIAATPEEDMIKEAIGSGPYKFVKEEWQPGNQVVYVRNPDYVPRNEAPSGAAGGKRVYVDRLVWRYIPDPATAAAALETGEVDFWEQPPLDYVPKIERNPAVGIVTYDVVGNQGWVRPNHLQPPFNNKKARQALTYMVDQERYLQARRRPGKVLSAERRVLRQQKRVRIGRRGSEQAGLRARAPAHERGWLRWQADCGAGPHQHRDAPCRVACDGRAATEDRLQGRRAGDGLGHPGRSAGHEDAGRGPQERARHAHVPRAAALEPLDRELVAEVVGLSRSARTQPRASGAVRTRVCDRCGANSSRR